MNRFTKDRILTRSMAVLGFYVKGNGSKDYVGERDNDKLPYDGS